MFFLEAVYSNKNDNVYIIHSFMTVLYTSIMLYISGHINSGLPIQYNCMNSRNDFKDALCIKNKFPKVRLGGFILVMNV
jgi:hypothetical protein